MPRQRSRKSSSNPKLTDNSPKIQDAERGNVDGENEGDSAIEGDSDEEELERLVLGDGNAFKEQWGRDDAFDTDRDSESSEDEEDAGDSANDNLEGMDDAALFILDAGPSTVASNALMPIPSSEDEHNGDAPAWEDSDDERLMVSLANNTRLRKLRLNESEDLINGKEYTKRLRRQFERLNPVPEWAVSSEGRPAKRRRRSSASSASSVLSDDMNLDDNLSSLPLARLLQDASAFTKTLDTTKKNKLRPEVIDIQRTRDIPTTNSSAVTSLAFHPQYPVLLSSGPSSTICLHRIDPTALPIPNPQLTSVHVKNTPLSSTEFLAPTGDKIFFSGRRRYFHTWDLETGTIEKVTRIYGHKDEQKTMETFKLSPCGRYMGLIGSGRKGGGMINVLDANTTQWIASARMEGRGGLADFAWWSDGEGFTVAGRGGEIGEWSLSQGKFLGRWIDDGAVGTTVISLGGRNGPKNLGSDRWVVVGSTSGVVNIYDRLTWNEENMIERPQPKKSFMQLTTPTSNLVFSPDGQLLVFSSKHKRDALRLVHLPSCTVYRNWPTSETPFGRISAVAFSSGSDMLAVGNEKGKIKLWEIRS